VEGDLQQCLAAASGDGGGLSVPTPTDSTNDTPLKYMTAVFYIHSWSLSIAIYLIKSRSGDTYNKIGRKDTCTGR
jgi:hypothetical protein